MKTLALSVAFLLMTSTDEKWDKVSDWEVSHALFDNGLFFFSFDRYYKAPPLEWVIKQKPPIGGYIPDANDCDDAALITIEHFRKNGEKPVAIGFITCRVKYPNGAGGMHAANVVLCSDGILYYVDYRAKIFKPLKTVRESGMVKDVTLIFI